MSSQASHAHPSLPGAAAPLARLADALPWCLLLLDAQAQVVQANRAARLLLARGAPLRMRGGRISPVDAAARTSFKEALTPALRGHPAWFRWPGLQGGFAARLQALPGKPGAVPLAMLLVAPLADAPLDLEAYAAAHRLSPAEARVLGLLVQGLATPAVARRLGVAVSTVRSQVLSLRRKTGHARVAHLLIELGRLPPLPAGPR